MKTVKDIYGGYMSKELAQEILSSAKKCCDILVIRRNELINIDIDAPAVDDVCEALEFWEKIEERYLEYLKKEKNV